MAVYHAVRIPLLGRRAEDGILLFPPRLVLPEMGNLAHVVRASLQLSCHYKVVSTRT